MLEQTDRAAGVRTNGSYPGMAARKHGDTEYREASDKSVGPDALQSRMNLILPRGFAHYHKLQNEMTP
jgi:hypothetical protein